MYVYIYTYICIYTYIHTYIHIYIYIYIYHTHTSTMAVGDHAAGRRLAAPGRRPPRSARALARRGEKTLMLLEPQVVLDKYNIIHI